jgi:hypothetical protein
LILKEYVSGDLVSGASAVYDMTYQKWMGIVGSPYLAHMVLEDYIFMIKLNQIVNFIVG